MSAVERRSLVRGLGREIERVGDPDRLLAFVRRRAYEMRVVIARERELRSMIARPVARTSPVEGHSPPGPPAAACGMAGDGRSAAPLWVERPELALGRTRQTFHPPNRRGESALR